MNALHSRGGRELERERKKLEREEAKIAKEIKKAAKSGDMVQHLHSAP